MQSRFLKKTHHVCAQKHAISGEIGRNDQQDPENGRHNRAICKDGERQCSIEPDKYYHDSPHLAIGNIMPQEGAAEWGAPLQACAIASPPRQLRYAPTEWPPCVKGAVGEADWGIVSLAEAQGPRQNEPRSKPISLQPLRHGFAVPPPLTQGRLCRATRAFALRLFPARALRMAPLTGELSAEPTER